MKTIAITVDEAMLERVDRLSSEGGGSPNRSKLIRVAVSDYLTRVDRASEEERERAVFRRHRTRLRRQAAALVSGQAKP